MYKNYYKSVKRDFEELVKMYPFSELCFLPTAKFSPLIIKCIAVNRKAIEEMSYQKSDLIGDYDKTLEIIVNFDYREKGCNVYGGKWLDDSICSKDKHFYQEVNSKGMHKLCVGVPESFTDMKNVILENVKTAENMLNAYELYQCGMNRELILKSYSHNEKGKLEYENDRNKYRSKY